ncbi:MAG: hypothetical protein GW775_00315, partial [Candidatus Magasanikbacteria bacterium]|nr:hypothetical protein [Candidatus Magasanikbacteria bacterium]
MGETKNLGPELERIRKQGQEQVSGNDENEQTGSDKTHARELTITPEIRAGYDKKVAADKKRREEEESEKKRNEIKHARGI